MSTFLRVDHQAKQEDKQTISFTAYDDESRKLRDYCYKNTKEHPVMKQFDKNIEKMQTEKLVIDTQIGVIHKERRLEREQTKTKTISRGMDFSL